MGSPQALQTDKADFIPALAQLNWEYAFLGKTFPLCYIVLVNKTIVKTKMIIWSKHKNIFNNVKIVMSLLCCVLSERLFWFYTTTHWDGSYKI
jgi:hypothetical protein